MKKLLFAVLLFITSVFGSHAHAQGTQLNPGTQINWGQAPFQNFYVGINGYSTIQGAITAAMC